MVDTELEKQVRFGTAGGINKTAFQMRKALINKAERDLNLTRKFIPQSLIVEKAKPMKNPFAVVGFLERAYFMDLLIEGGMRRARGNSISVPNDFGGVSRTKSGGISKANRPRQLADKPTTYFDNVNGKGNALWRRVGRGQNERKRILYTFHKTTDYRPRQYDFYRYASNVSNRYLIRNIEQAINNALRTAK